MTPARTPDLASLIPASASLLIDSSVVLAYLAGDEPASADAEQVFDGFVATGRNPAALSAITVAEILVRPFRAGSAAVAIAEGFLRHFADVRIVPVDYQVAREGAQIRASTNLPMPDSLMIASARAMGADVLVTADQRWVERSSDVAAGMSIVGLPVVAP